MMNAPQSFLDAYEAYVRVADQPNAPTTITLPETVVTPAQLRVIVKAFEPPDTDD
jgi:hypothetical protein